VNFSKSIQAHPASARHIVETLEEQYDVNNLTFRGIKIWPWVRNGLLFYYGEQRGVLASLAEQEQFGADIPSAHGPTSSAIETRGFEETLSALKTLNAWISNLQSSADAMPALQSITPGDILLIGQGNTRPVIVNHRRFDTQLDPIIRLIDGRWTWRKILIRQKTSLEKTPFFYATHNINPKPFTAILQTMDEMNARLFDAHDDEVKNWDNLVEELPRLDSFAPLPRNSSSVAAEMKKIERIAIFTEHLLRQTHPRLVLFVGQNVTTFGIACACRKLGIPCADIQHGAGATNPTKVKWFGWKNIPAGGYEFLPDYFLVWNEDAMTRIQEKIGSGAAHHRPLLFGNPWVSQNRTLKDGKSRTTSGAALTILVTLTQMSVASPSQHLLKAIEESPPTWRWLMRVHPADMQNQKRVDDIKAALISKSRASVDFDYASTAPLPVLLDQVDRHVSMYSSAYIDASAFGLGTIFVHQKAADLYPDILRKQGYEMALSAEDLLQILDRPQVPVASLIAEGNEIALDALKTILDNPPLRFSNERRS
jgi:hypothetical protein